jgi:hypothetical protein
MKNRLIQVAALGVLLASLLVAGSVSAQNVTTHTTAGTYAVTCEGYLAFPTPASPLVPAKELGTAIADEEGHFTGTTTDSIGGFAVFTETVSGTETVNPDGTGAITFTPSAIDGHPVPPPSMGGPPLIDISFVVSEHGNRIDGIVTDPGTVFACVLRRISQNDDQAAIQKHDSSPRRIPARHALPSNAQKSGAVQVVTVSAKAAKKPATATYN